MCDWASNDGQFCFLCLPLEPRAASSAVHHEDQFGGLLQKAGWMKGLVQHEGKSGLALLEDRLSGFPAELQGVKDPLSKMLQHDPTKRAQLQDLVNHQWLTV